MPRILFTATIGGLVLMAGQLGAQQPKAAAAWSEFTKNFSHESFGVQMTSVRIAGELHPGALNEF